MNYSRYWHGYLLYLKPLLLFFNVYDIKILMMFIQLLLIVWVEILLAKRSEAFAFFCIGDFTYKPGDNSDVISVCGHCCHCIDVYGADS